MSRSLECTRNLTRCFGAPCLCGRCITRTRSPRGPTECKCDSGWAGENCWTACNLPCQNGGVCVLKHGRPACNCGAEYKYTGINCTRLITTTTPGTILDIPTTVGVSVGSVLLVLALFIAACVVFWRKRSLFLLKLIHRFKAYDDNEEREYDAFISYKSSDSNLGSSQDERFVINHLLPKLERDYGFRICVHFRDFVPGLSISENVLAAIESSHRTIMLISRTYATESVWSRFEYEQAQIAVIEQRQRIIPVLMDDREKLGITDSTLLCILQSTTYMQLPGHGKDCTQLDEFFVRLRLSMPKKRAASTSQRVHYTHEVV